MRLIVASSIPLVAALDEVRTSGLFVYDSDARYDSYPRSTRGATGERQSEPQLRCFRMEANHQRMLRYVGL